MAKAQDDLAEAEAAMYLYRVQCSEGRAPVKHRSKIGSGEYLTLAEEWQAVKAKYTDWQGGSDHGLEDGEEDDPEELGSGDEGFGQA